MSNHRNLKYAIIAKLEHLTEQELEAILFDVNALLAGIETTNIQFWRTVIENENLREHCADLEEFSNNLQATFSKRNQKLSV